MQKTVYLDNAATTYVSNEVLQEMMPIFTSNYANPASLHNKGLEAMDAVKKARERVALAINAKPSEIIFTSGGTESDNLALIGIANALKEKGNHIMISAIEHHAIFNAAEELKRQGFDVTVLPVDENGMVNLVSLVDNMRKDTILISIMLANNEVGTIQNIRAIAKLAKQYNVYLHTDAVQAIGAVNIDVKKLDVDALSISAHKINGPKGVGALYLKSGVPIKPISFGGGQERGLRSGTLNVPGIVGLGKAIEVAVRDMPYNNQKLRTLRDILIKEVEERIEGVKLNGHRLQRLPNNVNFSFEGVEGESLMLMLNERGICVSTGSACNSTRLEPSHVLMAMGVDQGLAQGSIRFSLGKNLTRSDIYYVVENLVDCVKWLRSISPIKVKRKNKGEDDV